MAPSLGLGQFDIDANAIAGPADTALEEVARIEQAPDLGRCEVPTLELKARRFGGDQQVREAAERGDDILGDSVAEVILAGIARQVLERQHRHRRAARETSRSGKARDIDRLGRRAEPE